MKNFPSGKDDRRRLEKNNPTIALNALCVKKIKILLYIKIYILPTFQNTTQIMSKTFF